MGEATGMQSASNKQSGYRHETGERKAVAARKSWEVRRRKRADREAQAEAEWMAPTLPVPTWIEESPRIVLGLRSLGKTSHAACRNSQNAPRTVTLEGGRQRGKHVRT